MVTWISPASAVFFQVSLTSLNGALRSFIAHGRSFSRSAGTLGRDLGRRGRPDGLPGPTHAAVPATHKARTDCGADDPLRHSRHSDHQHGQFIHRHDSGRVDVEDAYPA